MDIIREELQGIGVEWNTHKIRLSNNCSTPPGIPDQLYFLSQLNVVYY